jgi:kynurenine formamidase
VFWPTGETFRLDKVADGVTDKGYYYASNNYSGNEHGGTHIDAPVHFAQGRWTVDQIPLDRLIGSAVVRGRVRREREQCGLPGVHRRLHGVGTYARPARARSHRPDSH